MRFPAIVLILVSTSAAQAQTMTVILGNGQRAGYALCDIDHIVYRLGAADDFSGSWVGDIVGTRATLRVSGGPSGDLQSVAAFENRSPDQLQRVVVSGASLPSSG